MLKFLKQIYNEYKCNHYYVFKRNTYGSEYPYWYTGPRGESVWHCVKCDKNQWRNYRHKHIEEVDENEIPYAILHLHEYDKLLKKVRDLDFVEKAILNISEREINLFYSCYIYRYTLSVFLKDGKSYHKEIKDTLISHEEAVKQLVEAFMEDAEKIKIEIVENFVEELKEELPINNKKEKRLKL